MFMEYGKAFAFFTDENDWVKKFLVAAVIPIVPIVGALVLAGYGLEITRRVIKKQTPVLPEWSDFGEYLKNGFLAAVIGLVYSLPAVLAGACLNGPAVAFQTQDNSSLQTTGAVLAICGGCLASLFSLAAALLVPPALGRFAATGQFGDALRLGDIVKLLRTKPGVYVVAVLLIGIAALILLPLGFVLCGVGIFLAVAFLNLAAAHLYGQAYRVAAAEAGMGGEMTKGEGG